LLWGRGGEGLPPNAMPASIAGLFNAMIFGILCNASWILTAISVLITVIVTLTYYSVIFNYVDFITISIVSNSMIFMVIALYKVEKRDKTELLQFAQIRRMNEELKSILMNLPEGILLINNETHEVVLQN
jgi:c-di-AMP phosphodiesterase-like protein